MSSSFFVSSIRWVRLKAVVSEQDQGLGAGFRGKGLGVSRLRHLHFL